MQSFLIGFIYYGNIFYVPMYFQYVKGYTALKSGALVLAYTLPQAFWGVLGGQIISRTNRYKAVIIFGSCMWTLSSGLQLLWGRTTSLGKVIGILQVNSLGVGWCLQTSKRSFRV
jgi:cyanate permease